MEATRHTSLRTNNLASVLNHASVSNDDRTANSFDLHSWMNYNETSNCDISFNHAVSWDLAHGGNGDLLLGLLLHCCLLIRNKENKICKENWLLSWFGFQNTFSLENSSIISWSIFTLKRQVSVFFIYLSILLLKHLSKTKRKTKNYQITHQMITKSVFQCLNSPQQERIVRKNVLTNWHEPNKRCVDLQHWFEHQQQICRWTRTRPSWEGTGRHNFRCRPDRHHWSPSNTHLPW